MTHGSLPFHSQIQNKVFLVTLCKLIEVPDIAAEFYKKATYLIQKWAIKFQNQKDILPSFQEVYIALKNKGINFPDPNENVFSFQSQNKVEIPQNNNPQKFSKIK